MKNHCEWRASWVTHCGSLIPFRLYSYEEVQQSHVPLDSSLRYQTIITDLRSVHELRPDQPGDSVELKDVKQLESC
jgi:hypothetical protein